MTRRAADIDKLRVALRRMSRGNLLIIELRRDGTCAGDGVTGRA